MPNPANPEPAACPIGPVEQLGRVELWHQRRTESDLARVQQEGRLWEAETEGIAQANFQSWIIEEAKRAGIGPVDIRLSINPGGGNTLKLRQLSAQIMPVSSPPRCSN